jgi:toxin ParE1/3/4
MPKSPPYMPSMGYRIRYRPPAVAQLDAIASYIEGENSAAAKRVIRKIKTSIGRLALFPYSSRRTEIDNIRVLAVVRYPYLVFYSVDEDVQEIHI